MDSSRTKRIGVIVEVVSAQVVSVKMLFYGKLATKNHHIKNLKLLHRPGVDIDWEANLTSD